MVTHKQLRLICACLKALRAALLLAIPATAVLLWAASPQAPALPSEEPVAVSQVAEEQVRGLSWYAPLWERDLKQPPILPAPTDRSEGPRKASGPLPKLLATLVETQGRYAHFVDAKGRVRMTGCGDAIGSYLVRTIEPGRVELEGSEGTVWVGIPRSKDRR